MKILFISSKDVTRTSNGGELCTNRNYLSFCKIVGDSKVEVIYLRAGTRPSFRNAISKRLNYLKGYYEGLSKKMWKQIKELSKTHSLVFIDSSIHGIVARKLKRSGYSGKIICFFHNVEYKIKLQKAKTQPWKLMEILVTRINEKAGVKYSDKIVVLNKRDQKELYKIYNLKESTIIPISLKDKLDSEINGITSEVPKFIFTGNNWYANIHGLDWFIDNVLCHVDITLQITGFGMDSLKNKYNHPQIEFLGFVDDLASYIKKADYVVSPIFFGSGMKVKTCEALMYGKNIVGTKESFEGYEVNFDEIGAVCNTKDEFISAINILTTEKMPKFNKASRFYYLHKYSFEATIKIFQELIK